MDVVLTSGHTSYSEVDGTYNSGSKVDNSY